ncbi:hypothetical protein VXE41_20460, partial [Acinetobacter variabilis]
LGLTRFSAGNSRFHRGFTRIDGVGRWSVHRRGLLLDFTRFGAGNSSLHRGFTRIDGVCHWSVHRRGLLLRFARTSFSLTRFTRGNRVAV